MSPELIGLLGMAALILLILTRMWIAVAMLIVGVLGMTAIVGFDQAMAFLGTIPFREVNYYPITVIPMFVLMGMVVAFTNIGDNLYDVAYKWIGHLKGGLAMATIAACGFLGAITGSHMVGVVAVSKFAYPQMKKYDYAETLSTGAIAAGAPLSILIPPSIALIMYGILTEQPVGMLFMAGLIPGILTMLVFMIAIYILCSRFPEMGPAGPKTTFKEKLVSLKGILPVVILFVVVIGGIYGGWFTPTEAGSFGALGALIIAGVTGQLSFYKLYTIFKESVLTTCMVIFLLAGTFVFIRFMTLSRLPDWLVQTVADLDLSAGLVVIVLALMYLFLGFFLPEIPMMVLTIPVVFPIIELLGINPIWFGVILVKMMTLGAISPPIGMITFILSGSINVPVPTIFKGTLPFIAADVVTIILIIAFPILSLYVPQVM